MAKSDEAITHVVEDGDTLESISEKYFGTRDHQFHILFANEKKRDSPLKPGEKFAIPGGHHFMAKITSDQNYPTVHIRKIGPPPRVVIPIEWGSHHGHARDFWRQFTLDVLVNGERASHAVSLADDGILEVSFRLAPGEYEVVIKEAVTDDRDESSCVVLFAQKISVGLPGSDDESEPESNRQE